MERTSILKNEKGFTMVEIIAVLVLLGILAAVAVPRYVDLMTESKKKAVDGAIAELSARENLYWGQLMLESNNGKVLNTSLLSRVDSNKELGNEFTWSGAISATGGTLVFKGDNYGLTRVESKDASNFLTSAPYWKR